MADAFKCVAESLKQSQAPDQLMQEMRRTLFSRVDALAQNLVYHPLGFLRVDVWADSRATLRLHVWPMPRVHQATSWSRHDHVWKLTSFVLFGHLLNRLFHVTSDSNAETRVFEVAYKDAANHLLPTADRVRVKLTSQRALARGDLYEIPAGTFHETAVAEDEFVSTIVLAERRSGRSPRVLAGDGALGHVTFRDACDYPEARRVLLNVYREIGRLWQ